MTIHSPANRHEQNCQTLTHLLYYVIRPKANFLDSNCRIENGLVDITPVTPFRYSMLYLIKSQLRVMKGRYHE